MLNVSFNIVFLEVIFFSINYALLYNIHLPYDLFLNQSVFFAINNFLLLAMINILIISRAEWKIAAWIDKWTIAVSVIEQILQHIMESITGQILQQFSWMLQEINECCNKWVLFWCFLFYQLLLRLTYS